VSRGAVEKHQDIWYVTKNGKGHPFKRAIIFQEVARGVKGRFSERLMEIYRRLYERFGPQGWWPADGPFEVIVGAILTQNTAWRNVERAIGNLKEEGLLDPWALLEVDEGELASLIRPAGYYNVKSKRLKAFIRYFCEKYQGNLEKMFQRPLPQLREELLGVDGIGPETADSILLYAGGRPVFVVDAYTRRALSRHHIIEEGATYQEVQELFMKNLPHDVELFKEYHALFVRLGKTHCRPKPLCEGCPLKDEDVLS